MSAPIIEVAEEVKDRLNAVQLSSPNPFSLAFDAVRVYIPKLDRESVGTLSVQVIPKDETRTRRSRGENDIEMKIDIGIRRALTQETDPTQEADNAELDALMAFVEEVKGFFEPSPTYNGRLPTTGAAWLKTENSLLFDFGSRMFLTIVTLTFKL